MNRIPIATTARCQHGTWACVRADRAGMPRGGKLVNFGGSSPGPGSGGASP